VGSLTVPGSRTFVGDGALAWALVAGALAVVLGSTNAFAQSTGSGDTVGVSGSSLPTLQVSGPPRQEHGAYLHDGLYVRYSLGPTVVGATGTGPAGSVGTAGPGVAEVLAIGGTPAPGLVIAGAAIAHIASPTVNGSETFLALANYGVLVDWFPDPAHGWHVGGAMGLGFIGYATSDGTARGFSVGGSVLGGYDFWLAPQWSVGVLVVATAGPTMSMHDTGPRDPSELMPAAIAIEASVLSH
jgi:hypothetical protein